MSPSSSSMINLHLACHCRTFAQTITLPQSSFPLKASICHCTTCRRSSGHQFGTFAVIPLPYPEDGSPPLATKGLVAYNKTAELTRWFCGTCGASCWIDYQGSEDVVGGEWEVASGVIRRVEVDGEIRREGVEELLRRTQIFVGDTGDGGAALWVNGGRLDGMDRRMWGRKSEIVTDEMLERMVSDGSSGKEGESRSDDGNVLLASCACEKVQLELYRKESKDRWLAGMDACESCRIVSGCEVTSWLAIPIQDVRMAGGGKLDLSADCFGRYRTSEKAIRTFCNGCGATIFYESEARDKFDVGVGLLSASDGARAQSWLAWGKYGDRHVAFMDDAMDQNLIERLRDGCKAAGDSTR